MRNSNYSDQAKFNGGGDFSYPRVFESLMNTDMDVKQATAVTTAIDHLRRTMDNEFVGVYKRFDEVDKSFDKVYKRFDKQKVYMDKNFVEVRHSIKLLAAEIKSTKELLTAEIKSTKELLTAEIKSTKKLQWLILGAVGVALIKDLLGL